jgi:hypothetical protein
MAFRTYTFVVEVPDDLTPDEMDFYADDGRRALEDDERVMFWAMEPGVTEHVIGLGAEPSEWPDQP